MQYYDQSAYYNPDQEEARRKATYGGTSQPYNPAYPTRIETQPQQPSVLPRQPSGEEGPQKPGGAVQPPPPNVMPPNPFVEQPAGPPPLTPEEKQKNISSSLLDQLMSFIGNPSRYNQDVVDSRFAHQRDVLGRGFDAQSQKINEDMARRGLFYSTEVAGRQGDLRGQQAQAEAGLLSDLTTDQAKTHAEDMQRAISTIMGFGGQQFNQQMATAQFNMLQDDKMREFLLSILGGA